MSNREARIGLDLRLHAYAPGGISHMLGGLRVSRRVGPPESLT